MSVSFMIMLAAGLSFIGLASSLQCRNAGAMLSEGREYMRYSAYIVHSRLAIVLSALSPESALATVCAMRLTPR